jgi:hypothetical protein
MFSWRSAVLWFVLLQLAGCAAESSGATGSDVSNVEVGMTQTQVLSILGQPQMREAYGPTEFLFYTSIYGTSVPIAIVDGKVTSVGRAAYDIVVRSKTQSASTASTRAKTALSGGCSAGSVSVGIGTAVLVVVDQAHARHLAVYDCDRVRPGGTHLHNHR